VLAVNLCKQPNQTNFIIFKYLIALIINCFCIAECLFMQVYKHRKRFLLKNMIPEISIRYQSWHSRGEYRLRRKERVKEIGFNCLRKREVERSEAGKF